MRPEIEQLLAIQEKDQRIRGLQAELAALPEEKRQKESQLKAAFDRLEASKSRVKEIEVQKKQLQMEAQGKRDTIIKYRQQQLQTRKNEEFQALTHEIEAAERAISDIEDRELLLMEETETLKPQIAAADKIYVEDKARIDTLIAALAEKQGNLGSRIEALKSDRVGLVSGVDEDVLDRYERLFRNKEGMAVVALEHEVCMGCHMRVTTQTVVQVKGEKEAVNCPQCGRILYIPA